MNLTSLSAVKAWLGSTGDTDNAMLSRLIAMASAVMLGYISRPNIARATYTDLFDGVGNNEITLRAWPVIDVNTIKLANNSNFVTGYSVPSAGSIPAAQAFGGNGFSINPDNGSPAGSPQVVTLQGYEFPRGRSNVQIKYEAGYAITDEARTVPATPFQLTPLCPNGSWCQDDGVENADTGAALVKVTTGTPTTGQYKVTQDPTTGVATYLFALADVGVNVFLNYSFIPADLEQICIETVGERYRYKNRIGVVSTTLGGQETMSYSQKDMSDFVKSALSPYKKWFPL